MLASLRDADSLARPCPVVSLRSTTGYQISSRRDDPASASLRDADFISNLHPVVSLRSTTGYRISSLRDDAASLLPSSDIQIRAKKMT